VIFLKWTLSLNSSSIYGFISFLVLPYREETDREVTIIILLVVYIKIMSRSILL
jgi:hypothetical protein